jgi:hypothetical protein
MAWRIGWPSSPLEPDVLFLIPLPWVAPVAVPVAISLLGATASTLMLYLLTRSSGWFPCARHWLPFLIALAVWFCSFVEHSGSQMDALPERYSWGLFAAGVFFCLAGIGILIKEIKHGKK